MGGLHRLEFNIDIANIIVRKIGHLPQRLPCVFVVQNCDGVDLATALELFFDLFLLGCVVHVLHEDGASVSIVGRLFV